jgi:hypothetical protein
MGSQKQQTQNLLFFPKPESIKDLRYDRKENHSQSVYY